MLTFKRIRFVLGMLVLSVICFGQSGPGYTNPGLAIDAPNQVYVGQNFSVDYYLYHDYTGPTDYFISGTCNQCDPQNAVSMTQTVANFTSTKFTLVFFLPETATPGNSNVTITGNATSTNPFAPSYTASSVQADALPVTLLSFNVLNDGSSIKLTWQTATELNNEAFMVEKSLDGAKFFQIGKVDGAGTTFETQNYNFVDENPGKGVAYYRLKQMDFDGSYEYSDVVSVVLDGRNDDAVVYPNPVSGMATLRFEEEPLGPVSVKVFNAVGVEVSRYEVDMLDGKELNFDVSILPVGTYFVKVEKDNTTSTTVLKKL